MVFSDTTQVV